MKLTNSSTGTSGRLKNPSAVNKPARLTAGACIGVIAPAGCVDQSSLQAGIQALRAQGFEVELGRAVFARKGYLAGDARDRAKDLVDFFYRGDIDAIFCARGGFGSIQVLPHLNPELSRYPKIFVGYSDVTILLNWLRQVCGMVSFHAPMVAMDLARGLSDRGKDHLWGLLSGKLTRWNIKLEEAIRPGTAEAEIVGGCLSLLVTTLATPYEIQTRGKLLFMEDIGERPYRIERMLTHMKMAGKLDDVAGVLFGDFTDCEGEGSRGVKDVIVEMFQGAPYPVLMGMKAGHGDENLALPFGTKMILDSAAATLEMVESPVA